MKYRVWNLTVILVLAVFMSAQMVRAGEIPVKDWKLAGGAKIVDGLAVVEVPEDSRVGEILNGQTQSLELAKGVFRIKALVKAEPEMSMGYRLVLTVRPADPKAEYKRYRHGRDQITPRPKELWLALAEKRPSQHDADGWVTLETELALTASQACQIAVGWKIGESHIGGSSLKKEDAPAPLDRLTLKSLQVEKSDMPFSVGKLQADKVVYKPGMKPELSITITNTDDKPIRLPYHVRMAKDLESPAVVAKGEEVAAGSAVTDVKIALPALEKFGGYRFDFDLLDKDGKTVVSRERSAACSNSFNRIGIGGINHLEYIMGSANATKEICEYAFANAREDYISWFELGFWAPDDFSNLTPEKDRFLSNIMSLQWRTGIKNIADACRKNGIAAFAYIKGNYADGRDGMLFVQRHPELATYQRDTCSLMGNQDMERIVNWDDYEKRIAEKNESGIATQWSWVYLDATRPSVVDVCADQTIASKEMFGWAGVRFDGDFSIANSETFFNGPIRNLKGKVMATAKDTDFTFAANINRYKQKVLEAVPGFEFGFNHYLGDKAAGDRVTVGDAAVASGDSMVMNEPIRGFGHEKEAPYNKWDGFADLVSCQSKICRALGGFLQIIGCYEMRADDYLYQNVYVLAAQAKPFGPFYFNTPYNNRLSRFVTRYAGILCADLNPIPSPESRITVESPAKLEWQHYASYLDASRKNRYYVIQMINPPVNERAVGKETHCLLRPPVKDVKVRLDLDSFETAAEAWQLDPWFDEDQIAVKVTPGNGGVDMTLPRPVSVWSVLVVKCELRPTR